MQKKAVLQRIVSFTLLLLTLSVSRAQQKDSLAHFSGSVLVTNNGISLIPTFTLGKPATIINLSTGRGKLSFEPELRFALEGKPWSFLFWWRYKLVRNDRFRITLGMHPAVSFKTAPVVVNGSTQEGITAQRFLAGEFAPNYVIGPNATVGVYYLYSHGFETGSPSNTHFLTLNTNLTQVPLGGKLYMRFAPQVYYLQLDQEAGIYASSTLAVSMHNCPVSISAIFNKEIHSHISVGKPFIWNTSVVYSFRKTFRR